MAKRIAKATLPTPVAVKKAPVPKKGVIARKTAVAEAAAAVMPVLPKPARSGGAAKKAAAVPVKPKPERVKLVRDSFTIPRDEYESLRSLKLRAAKLGHVAKKSEMLRAGLKALEALSDDAMLKTLSRVPSIKTGRPKNDAA